MVTFVTKCGACYVLHSSKDVLASQSQSQTEQKAENFLNRSREQLAAYVSRFNKQTLDREHESDSANNRLWSVAPEYRDQARC